MKARPVVGDAFQPVEVGGSESKATTSGWNCLRNPLSKRTWLETETEGGYGSKGSGHIRDSHALSHRRETGPGYFDVERVFVDVGARKHSEIAQASKRILPILE